MRRLKPGACRDHDCAESQWKFGESHSVLIREHVSALSDFLQRHFQSVKLLRTQFREHSFHLSGVLSEGFTNEVFATRSESNDPHAPVFGALDPANQAFRDEAVDSNTDRARGQIDDWAYRIHGQ